MVPSVRQVFAGLLASLLLAACSPIVPNLVLPTPAAEEATPGEKIIAVTPLNDAELSAEELAQILQIARWRFDLQMPAGEMLHYRLELRQPNQDPLHLAGFSMQSPDPREDSLLVALYPIDGSILDAEQINAFIGIGGSSTSAVIENPARGYTFVSPLTPAQPLERDGGGQSFTLMAFSQTGRPIPSPENARIVLTVQPARGEPQTSRPEPAHVLPEPAEPLHQVTADLDGDGVAEMIVLAGWGGSPARLGNDALELFVIEQDQTSPEVVWQSGPLRGERGEPLQVQDLNRDGRPEILSRQALGAAGETLYVLAWRQGTFDFLRPEGGYFAGWDSFGETGVRLADRDADGAFEILADYGPATAQTDVYGWNGDAYVYMETLAGATD